MRIKNYLYHAMLLEKSIYGQKQIIASMERAIAALQKPRLIEKKGETKLIWALESGIFEDGILMDVWYGFVLGALLSAALFVCGLFCGGLGLKSIVICAYTIVLVLFVIGYIRLVKSTKKKNKQIQAHNKDADAKNSAVLKRNQAKISSLQLQLATAKKNLKETQELLQKLYGYNMIHPKYRGLIPVATLYDYFDTGMCSALTGHGGAYETYEYQLRLNVIIGKLDTIITKLDEIQRTQYSLYSALSECNRNLTRVNSGLKQLQASNDQIAQCAQITAHNSQITASNTSMMKQIMIYDQLKR